MKKCLNFALLKFAQGKLAQLTSFKRDKFASTQKIVVSVFSELRSYINIGIGSPEYAINYYDLL